MRSCPSKSRWPAWPARIWQGERWRRELWSQPWCGGGGGGVIGGGVGVGGVAAGGDGGVAGVGSGGSGGCDGARDGRDGGGESLGSPVRVSDCGSHVAVTTSEQLVGTRLGHRLRRKRLASEHELEDALVVFARALDDHPVTPRVGQRGEHGAAREARVAAGDERAVLVGSAVE